MYTAYFGITENPFALTPDPRYLYMSRRHQEALAYLLYGVGASGGFLLLTGEIGAGKTTVCRCLMEQLPEHVDVALLLNPNLTPYELVAALCDELHIRYPKNANSLKVLVDVLNRHLLDVHSNGRRTVLIIDEAQNLTVEALEQIRMLTNLETDKHKLLQFILIGQPELRGMLEQPGLRQLSQRITARYHLLPLNEQETIAYIGHRLSVAGLRGRVFSTATRQRIYQYSRGIPRLINTICDRALLGAYARERSAADKRIIDKAAAEVTGKASHLQVPKAAVAVCLLLSLVGVGYAGVRFMTDMTVEKTTQPETAIQVATPPLTGSPASLPLMALNSDPRVAQTRTLLDRDSAQALDAASKIQFKDALSDLFDLWGVDYQTLVGNSCKRAEAATLRCHWDDTNWQELREINRAALLVMEDAGSEQRFLVISGLQDTQARVMNGEQQFSIPVRMLAKSWTGRSLTLWKPPFQPMRSLLPGQRDDSVLWLRQRLAEISGQSVTAKDDTFFDEPLRQQVLEFQRAKALKSDGIVGPMTQLHLQSSVNDATTPLLWRPSQ